MHLPCRTRRRRAAVTGAAAAAALVAVAGTAQAQGADHARRAPARTAAPAYLAATELPPHPRSDWYADGVAKGLPEPVPYCVRDTLPSSGAGHRTFRTDYETNAVQIVVTTGSADAATRLAAAVERKIRACAADYRREYPPATASWRDYGTVTAEDGAHVYGVHTALPDSEPAVGLYGVGRDGRTVTVVEWADNGGLDLAPVPAFRRTTATAVTKLYA
ncbi:hypothetical protein RKE29_28680 [Streptomyces sp. B1866]|uniref:hypothetical protein n=1 Tax=Streptomyces sp. B1866 TaxID=3075431 RepID=UPI00288F5254|nr:hypothetical protein [Streptomyces sp. B1866]MDT3400539.1 hypothetical protein [Streptomyces sp. B1866]